MENDSPLVSVICAAYNHEKYIRDALEGFANQKTNFRYEVIIHDDASTDQTAQIIKEYETKYPDIFKPVYQKENQYSKGVAIHSFTAPLVRGKYVAFCEGDDYWCDDTKLQRQADLLEAHPEYSACAHNTEFLNMADHTRTVWYPANDMVLGLKDCVMYGGQSFHTSSIMVRSEIYLHRPAFTTSVWGVGDYLNAIMYALCGDIYYFSDVMSVYRQNVEGSWTARVWNSSEKQIQTRESLIQMLTEADEYTEKKHHDLFLRAIRLHQYQLNRLRKDYKKLIADKENFHKERRKTRIKYYILALFPFLSEK